MISAVVGLSVICALTVIVLLVERFRHLETIAKLDQMRVEYDKTILENLQCKSTAGKYHELPGIDSHLYQQFLLGILKSDYWTYLLDTYLHQFTAKCGTFAESGSVNGELLNSGKIQGIRGLAEYVEICVNQIRMQQAMEQHESVSNE